MHPGVVEVAAYQETLLLMAAFGIAILAMIWAGFRRWVEHKDNVGRVLAEQTAERSAQHAAQMQRIEARLDAIERSSTHENALQVKGERTDQVATGDMTCAEK